MQFKPFEPDIEVSGAAVNSIIAGLGSFRTLSNTILLESNLGRIEGGNVIIDHDSWYSQAEWLKAFEQISQHLGDNTLYNIGKMIPDNAIFPPDIDTIEAAIQSIDVAYHMNHRKNGIIMFDGTTMIEGIGHYGFKKVPDKNIILSECTTPYPCAFDQGIITAMALKLQPGANVAHDEKKPCRKNNASTCNYVISW